MLHKVLSQLASFLTNSVNNSLVEHGDDGSKLTIILVTKIVKFITRFFLNIENHIMEGSVPDSVLNFTPRDLNPKLLQTPNIMVAPYAKVSTLKAKPETSPPSTPAHERTGKKQKIKTAPGAKDFTKAGLFHCKLQVAKTARWQKLLADLFSPKPQPTRKKGTSANIPPFIV
jgi:hypothetical protein